MRVNQPFVAGLALVSFGALIVFEILWEVTKVFAHQNPVFIESLRNSWVVGVCGLTVYAVYSSHIPPVRPGIFYQWLSLPLLCHIVFVVLYIFNPEWFLYLSLEDRPVETISALLCFLASGVLIYAAWRIKTSRSHPVISAWVLLGIGLVVLLIGLEEISWFQRFWEYETPVFMGANDQGEANFHNLATAFFEDSYYIGTYMGFILIPFMAEQLSWGKKWKWADPLIPSRFIIPVASLATVYNYDIWIDLHIKFGFFIALCILIYYGFFERRGEYSRLFQVYAVVNVISQIIFLTLASPQGAEGLPEYKELFIPTAIVFYAWEVLKKAKG